MGTFALDPKDLRVEVFTGGGTSVRVTHVPTGMVAIREDCDSRIKGRRECIAELEERIKSL